MTKEQLIELIKAARKNYDNGVEELRGMNFSDDQKIITKLRMKMFEKNELKVLPTEKELLERIDEGFFNKYINEVLFHMASLDYKYTHS